MVPVEFAICNVEKGDGVEQQYLGSNGKIKGVDLMVEGGQACQGMGRGHQSPGILRQEGRIPAADAHGCLLDGIRNRRVSGEGGAARVARDASSAAVPAIAGAFESGYGAMVVGIFGGVFG